MKISSGKINSMGLWDEAVAGQRLISSRTQQRLEDPAMTLYVREADTRKATGRYFVFQVNPQRLRSEQSALVAVQRGLGGYVVTENGMGEPRWSLTGTLGWRLREVRVPEALRPDALLNVPKAQITVTAAERALSRIAQGVQLLDGMQAWDALRDLITWYFTQNQLRPTQGKAMLEMVWYDALHGNKWVVKPTGAPSLDRSVASQASMPYQLDLIGVYDDTKRAAQVALVTAQLTGKRPTLTHGPPSAGMAGGALVGGDPLLDYTDQLPDQAGRWLPGGTKGAERRTGNITE